MTNNNSVRQYGDGDTSFQAAGGEPGIRRLVKDFYDAMREMPAASRILSMHPDDLDISEDKLARFLCGWLGGPKLYSEKYGSIRLPMAHKHLDIGDAERDAWMACMTVAVAKQNFPESFKRYLLEQLFVPAERIRIVSEAQRSSEQ